MKDYTLSKSDLRILKLAHRRQRNKRLAYRINAVYLLGKGWQLVDVSEALMLDEDTLRRYANRYREGKIPLLLSDDYQAYEGKLTTEELRLLDEHLQEVTYRRASDILAYIEQEFDVDYSIRGLTLLLNRLGYSYKKPRCVPGKANKALQKKFLSDYRKIRENMGKNDHMYFMDGVHPQHNPLVMCGWMKRGQTKKLRTNTQYHRLNINGAIDVDTLKIITQYSSRLTAETTLDFLEKLRAKQPKGKIYLVLDNAGYYQTPRVQEYAKACAIELLYLPPYSPNLNLIERVWLFFQKKVLYNCYYPTFNKFRGACIDFFKEKNQRKYRGELASIITENFELVSA